MSLDAIIWDFDGTMVDSLEHNRNITLKVLEKMNIAPPEELNELEQYRNLNYMYRNWQDLYRFGYKMNEEEVYNAGKLWSPLQTEYNSNLKFYPGIKEIIIMFKDKLQAICSQNSKLNIEKILELEGVKEIFNLVIGYEEVAHAKQKPDPEALIICLKKFFDDNAKKTVVYIGDHEEDSIFAKNADQEINQRGTNVRIISIIISFDNFNKKNKYSSPDYRVNGSNELKELLLEIEKL